MEPEEDPGICSEEAKGENAGRTEGEGKGANVRFHPFVHGWSYNQINGKPASVLLSQ